MITHASVFSGIGGPEVAATMLGWENLFHCEINPFGKKVLDYWYPNSKSYDDITKTDFTEWRGRVTVLTGGFPCQPFSYAGRRRGAEDDRYLWPHMFRCIDEIQPDWVVAENVAGILTMVEQGEVSEMAKQATLFDEGDGVRGYRLQETFTLQRICDDLESHGYTVQPVLIPACAVGAPHRRDRVFIVARRIASDTDNRADRRTTREDEGKGGEERIQERHEVRKPDEPNQVRPESAGNVISDTASLRQRTDDRDDRQERQGGTCWQHVPQGDTEWRLRAGLGQTGEPRTSADTDSNRHSAQAESPGLESSWRSDDGEQEERSEPTEWSERLYSLLRNTEDTMHGGFIHGQHEVEGSERNIWNVSAGDNQRICDRASWFASRNRWEGFPSVSPVHRGNDGIPFDVDRLTISFGKWRTEALKAYGNAIVPQVMYEIFRAIEQTILESNDR